MAVGVLFGPVSLRPPPPSFGKPACKQVEAWSLNVSDSKPEVGSASAGQTSFAGVEKRGEGGQTAVGHLKPSAAGSAREREGEGAEAGVGGRVGEQGGESPMPPRSWGLPGPFPVAPRPQPPPRASSSGALLGSGGVRAARATGASCLLGLSEVCRPPA